MAISFDGQVVVITGAGDSFSAGEDLKEFFYELDRIRIGVAEHAPAVPPGQRCGTTADQMVRCCRVGAERGAGQVGAVPEGRAEPPRVRPVRELVVRDVVVGLEVRVISEVVESLNGASAALMLSHIPFPTPVGAVRIGRPSAWACSHTAAGRTNSS